MKYRLVKTFTLLLIIASFSGDLQAQISGHIWDIDGNALPYASIYIKGTSIGTTSNEGGEYFLDVTAGTHIVVCEYLGYKGEEKEVTIKSNEVFQLDFSLHPVAINLQELNISAGREDPAYAIIRNAQTRRKENLSAEMPQKCEMYMKGNMALDSLPDRFMTISMDEAKRELDSIGSNLLYLSETISTLYRSEKGLQEVIHSSRVSGSSMYSLNRGALVEYSIYERSLRAPIGDLINPIGPSAFIYYDFQLLSKDYTESDIVNTILVKPKNSSEPTVEGIIYIAEDGWKVDGFSFISTGKKIQQELIDTFKLEQEYIKVGKNKVLFKNRIDLKIKLLGFEINGMFLAVYTDYIFGAAAISQLDKRQVLEFQDSSQQRSLEYWDNVRPLKLTETERKDYVIKDSISLVLNSPTYLDSMDRIANRYRPLNILTGYQYRKRSRSLSFGHESPLNGASFDPIRALSIPLDFYFRKVNKVEAIAGLSYGFGDERLRYHGSIRYIIDPHREQEIGFYTGSRIDNINSERPFSMGMNAFMSIYFHRNVIRFYNNRNYGLSYKQRIFPGLKWAIHGEYGKRNMLENNTEYSLFYKKLRYHENIIENKIDNQVFGLDNRIFRYGTQLEFYPGTRYSLYPGGEIRTFQRGYNKLVFSYDGAIDIYNTDIAYHKMGFVYARGLSYGYGFKGKIYAETNIFVGKRRPAIQDLIWVSDNGSFLINSLDISQRFLGLDGYTYYTDKYSLQLHYYHNFNGFIMNKIPGIRKLGWNLTAKASTLYMADMPHYMEFGLGIDRIGWKLIRPFRFDFVLPVKDLRMGKVRYIIGFKYSLGAFNVN